MADTGQPAQGIDAGGSGARVRSSILDVARLAGVSPGSVSNVINGRRRQDDALGQAVLRAAAALDYRADTFAANLRRGQSGIIGLVIPDFENPFFAELVATLEDCAEASHLRLFTASSRGREPLERRNLRELAGWRAQGLILAPARGDAACEAALLGLGVPAVLLDRVGGSTGLDSVGVANADAAAEVTRALIALGHRRILVAHLGDGVNNADDRQAGVRAALGPSPQAEAVFVTCGPTVATSRAALDAHLAAAPAPTAVFCLNNLAALAAYGALTGVGLRPGHEVALVSFDDSAWMGEMVPPVAAVVQPVAAMARAAWDLLMARIEGQRAPVTRTRLPCRFERRGTMIPPGGADGHVAWGRRSGLPR